MNELLSRLKNSVNKQILNKVDKSLLEQYKFVPISVKDKYLFVAVSLTSDKDAINEKLRQSFPYQIKFIAVEAADIDQLIVELYKNSADPTKANAASSAVPQGKLGELLIQKGYITDVQLLQALAESKRQKIPIGSMLFKLKFITLEQLKEILHLQTGYEVVTADQLVNQKQYINILPEDFIKNNKIVPISSDGKTLLLGVVTPVKSDILKQVIFLTGQNPKQLLMTHFEFENAMNTFFSESKKETQNIIKQIESEVETLQVEESLSDMVNSELEDSSGSIAKFVNQIITTAIDSHVSDIHIEPRLSGYIVRYRKDGMLSKVLDIPTKVETSVIARFKVL